MRKMKLELDALEVESFETAAGAPTRGTVEAHQALPAPTEDPSGVSLYEPFFSCNIECIRRYVTCGPTCANTCRESCPATCPVSCAGCLSGGCGNLTVNTGDESGAGDCMSYGCPGLTM